jgi:hypothetical protein
LPKAIEIAQALGPGNPAVEQRFVREQSDYEALPDDNARPPLP